MPAVVTFQLTAYATETDIFYGQNDIEQGDSMANNAVSRMPAVSAKKCRSSQIIVGGSR